MHLPTIMLGVNDINSSSGICQADDVHRVHIIADFLIFNDF